MVNEVVGGFGVPSICAWTIYEKNKGGLQFLFTLFLLQNEISHLP